MRPQQTARLTRSVELGGVAEPSRLRSLGRYLTAARWAYLADQLAADGYPVDRAGAGPVVEVYPAGARAVWGSTGKRSTQALLQAAPWLLL